MRYDFQRDGKLIFSIQTSNYGAMIYMQKFVSNLSAMHVA